MVSLCCLLQQVIGAKGLECPMSIIFSSQYPYKSPENRGRTLLYVVAILQ